MPEPITKWFKPAGSDIQQTVPSEAPKALQIEERFEKLESALVHPFKSIENIERYMERLNILMERLEADNLIRRQFDDIPISIGATVTYQLSYNRHLYAYIYSNTNFTLQVSTGATQVIPANYWTNVSYPRGSYFTVVNGSDVTLQNCVVRTCDVPMEMATQQISGTVVANAGTNLNTSLLALESGGNLAAARTDLDKFSFAPDGSLTITVAKRNASVPTGAGNTVVSNGPGAIVSLLVTTAGTGAGDVLIFDNATTNSGTVIGVIPATVSLTGNAILINGYARNGITAQNVLNGPVFTVFYSS